MKSRIKKIMEPKAGKIGVLIEKQEYIRHDEDRLSAGELTMIGVGGIIGAGFFLASGIAIKQAGPAVLINFLLGGIIMAQVFSALAEMSVANPVEGSFRVYAEEALGRMAGFVSGWMYWIAGVLVMSSEVTASAIFTSYWFPEVPLWIFTLIYSLLIIGVNSLGVKEFGIIESWFAGLKVGALIVFIIVGMGILTGVIPPLGGVGFHNYIVHGGFFPFGLRGILEASMLVLISFGGVVVAGMAASQTINPRVTVLKATRNIVLILLTLYIGSLLVLLAITPWNTLPKNASPFVVLFRYVNIPYAGSIMNFIILTAALSTMNAAMYAVTRVLFSLGKGDYAPTFLIKTNNRGVAYVALAASSIGLALAVVLSYVLPDTVYQHVTSSAGFILFFNWILILLTHIYYRPILIKKYELKHKAWGYPYTSWAAVFALIGILLSTVLSPVTRIGFLGGLTIIILLSVFYFFAKKSGYID